MKRFCMLAISCCFALTGLLVSGCKTEKVVQELIPQVAAVFQNSSGEIVAKVDNYDRGNNFNNFSIEFGLKDKNCWYGITTFEGVVERINYINGSSYFKIAQPLFAEYENGHSLKYEYPIYSQTDLNAPPSNLPENLVNIFPGETVTFSFRFADNSEYLADVENLQSYPFEIVVQVA